MFQHRYHGLCVIQRRLEVMYLPLLISLQEKFMKTRKYQLELFNRTGEELKLKHG